MPCPVDQQANPESCGALFGKKADGEQCSQITCPKALGVTMKLICGGGCCPSCWAPDHVINLDRHTSIDDAAVVDAAPQAPSSCGGVKCFKTACAAGFTEGFVMDPKDGHAQIDYMRQFILHEAREQASEIDAKADQEFYAEKLRLVKMGSLKIQAEHDRRMNEVSVSQQIAQSNIHNKKKLEVLEAKNKLVSEAFQAAASALGSESKKESVIVGLIKQGCQSFQAGSSIKVRCRQEDESVVKSAIAKVGNVTFDNNYILKSFASTFTSECLGGVILSNSHNNVIVDQTFNARLTVCFERAVPVLKPMLFGGGGSKHFD